MLESLKFELGKVWKYDPHHIIYNTTIVIEYSPYVHHLSLEIEWLDKKENWSEI
jgi:hypothetical protein